MWSFRAYLKAKCADPAFRDEYHEQCTICPKTVMIIKTIREQRLTNAEVARRSGVTLERLDLLESADHCSFDDVQKLGRCLNLSFSNECRKMNRNKINP
jgi:hypothetical protein